MTQTQQAINPRGTLQNMLNEGFNERASLSEKIDNALDAGATKMKIYFETLISTIVFADNGSGMNEDQAKEAQCINNRKEKSRKHGCFGRGGTQSTIFLTNLETKSRCLSKTVGKTEPLELVIDWKKCVDKNEYDPRPHDGVTSEGMSIWNRYAINKNGPGTIFVVPCKKERFELLKDQIETESNLITQSLTYWFGMTYYSFIADNFELTLVIDNKEKKIKSHNPLYPHYEKNEYRKNTDIQLVKTAGGETRIYYIEGDKMGYREFANSNSGKRIIEPISPDSQVIGNFNFSSLYLPREVLPDVLENFDNSSLRTTSGSWNRDSRINLYGIFYQRNRKIVCRLDNPAPTSGDKDKYKFYEDVCHCISFDAEMDDYFDIQVNKSKIDVSNIDKQVSLTVKHLMNQFAKHIIKISNVPATPVQPPPPQQPQIVVVTEQIADVPALMSESPVVQPPPKSERSNVVQQAPAPKPPLRSHEFWESFIKLRLVVNSIDVEACKTHDPKTHEKYELLMSNCKNLFEHDKSV